MFEARLAPKVVLGMILRLNDCQCDNLHKVLAEFWIFAHFAVVCYSWFHVGLLCSLGTESCLAATSTVTFKWCFVCVPNSRESDGFEWVRASLRASPFYHTSIARVGGVRTPWENQFLILEFSKMMHLKISAGRIEMCVLNKTTCHVMQQKFTETQNYLATI